MAKNELVELLKVNKNLILTGAPGTGKTYLAKQIANDVIGNIVNYSSSEELEKILKEEVKKFPDNDKKTEIEEKRNIIEEKRKNFFNKFDKDKIKDFNLKEYCIGDGNHENFCWWLERNLEELGKYHPGGYGSRSYGIYFNKEKKKYLDKDKNVIDNAEQYIKGITETLQEIVNIGGLDKAEEKIEELSKNKFSKGFILKILNTYFPNNWFPIYSQDHMKQVFSMLALKIKDKKYKNNYFYINKEINNYYKNEIKKINENITVYEFMNILYTHINDKVEFVQFHPSYDYTDFVEGLKPISKVNLSFERKDGLFKEFCKKAAEDKDNKYVFIIDEINRGDISKIFGELFYCIEPSYRGEEHKIKTQYNYLIEENEEEDIFKNGFYVPDNVYIIGTMNDIDRSVESFDFAIRRRFVWKEIKAEDTFDVMFEELKLNEDIKKEAKKRMKNLNKKIEEYFDSSSYHIGAAYFLHLEDYYKDEKNKDKAFNDLWELHLEPLLKEYLRGTENFEDKLKELKSAYDNKKSKTEEEKTK